MFNRKDNNCDFKCGNILNIFGIISQLYYYNDVRKHNTKQTTRQHDQGSAHVLPFAKKNRPESEQRKRKNAKLGKYVVILCSANQMSWFRLETHDFKII